MYVWWRSSWALPEIDYSRGLTLRSQDQGYIWYLDQVQVPQGHHAIQQGHVLRDPLKTRLPHLALTRCVGWIYCHEHLEQDRWKHSSSCQTAKESLTQHCFEGQVNFGRIRWAPSSVLLWPTGCLLVQKIRKKFPCVWISCDVKNMQKTETGTWRYVNKLVPKHDIKWL